MRHESDGKEKLRGKEISERCSRSAMNSSTSGMRVEVLSGDVGKEENELSSCVNIKSLNEKLGDTAMVKE